MITRLMRTGLAAGLLAATALTAVPALAQQTTLTLGADAADIGIVDQLFSRVGAADDLGSRNRATDDRRSRGAR